MPRARPAASSRRPTHPRPDRTARTVRFPEALRVRLSADAERCGRSFEAQVLAILRRHYGEDVDISPAPDVILGLARGSMAGVAERDLSLITGRLRGGSDD